MRIALVYNRSICMLLNDVEHHEVRSLVPIGLLSFPTNCACKSSRAFHVEATCDESGGCQRREAGRSLVQNGAHDARQPSATNDADHQPAYL
eukprot:5376042-Karenia_brevis.AAC.1